jgi:hypothetical protein
VKRRIFKGEIIMRKGGIIPLIGIIITSLIISTIGCDCTKWEVQTQIHPVVLDIDKDRERVSIKYELGSVTILDDLVDLKSSHIQLIEHDKSNLTLNLVIKYADLNTNDNGFYYYYGSSKLCKSDPVDYDHLQRFSDEIPGFKWFIKHSVSVEDPENLEEDKGVSKEKQPSLQQEPPKKDKVKRL